MGRNEVQSAMNDSTPIAPYHVHNQASFGKPVITEQALFTCPFRRWVSLFKYLQEFKVMYQ